MAIPTHELLGLFYPSKNLNTSFAPAPDLAATSNSTILAVATNALLEPDDYWNGAVGFFVEPSQASLRGICFHVKKWDSVAKMLHITTPFPVVPTTGDVFKLFVGGKWPSDFEVLSMKASGKQPEIDTVTGTNVTGVTLRKVSGMLGEGTLTILYTVATRSLTIRMGANAYGPDTFVTGDGTYAVFNNDLAGFVLVDVIFSALRNTGTTYNDTFTLTIPKGNLVPNFEGYETNDGAGRTRYHLVVAKNKSAASLDVMNAISLWTGRPVGTASATTGTFNASFTAP